MQKEGLIHNLALTNFDSAHVEEIVNAGTFLLFFGLQRIHLASRLTFLIMSGIPIVSNQVQYSLIDTRPEVKMKDVCLKHNVKLLTYGTLVRSINPVLVWPTFTQDT